MIKIMANYKKNNKSKIAKMVKQTMRTDKEKQNYKTSKYNIANMVKHNKQMIKTITKLC